MKLIVQGLVAIVLLAALGAGGGAFWAWNQLNTPVAHDHSTEVEIPSGFSPDAALARLVENGIVKDPLPLRVYMKLTGAGKLIKAGMYTFGSPITPLQALKKLESGGDALARVTVIEGWTRWDIANALAHTARLGFKDSAQALAMLDDTSLIKDISPQATSLEGYLYPDTYFIDAHTTREGLVSQMVARFRQVWKDKLQERAKSAGLSAQQVVTIASLIETEAKLKEDRPIVSSVIYNRLRRKIPLALDSTIVYASKQAGKWRYDGKVYQSDIDRKSPYNTRQVTGLPPGPIGAPGLSCLEAALHPAQTDYIYYVRNPARNDGAHNFYSDAASFEQGVQALRNWERDRDLRAAKASASPPRQAVAQTPKRAVGLPRTTPVAPVHRPRQVTNRQKPVAPGGKTTASKPKFSTGSAKKQAPAKKKPAVSRNASSGKHTTTKRKQPSRH